MLFPDPFMLLHHPVLFLIYYHTPLRAASTLKFAFLRDMSYNNISGDAFRALSTAERANMITKPPLLRLSKTLCLWVCYAIASQSSVIRR